MTRRRLRVDDLLRIAVPSCPALSPDGTTVVYVLRTLDPVADRNVCTLWSVRTDSSDDPERITEGQAPAWSPDGSRLAFLRSIDGGAPQIWLLGSGAVTDLPDGAGTPVWSPDGTRIAFSAPVAGPDRPAPGEPIVIDRSDYRSDWAGLRVGLRNQLHLLTVATGEVRQLTELDWDAGDPVWSPDCTQLAFCGDPSAAAAFTFRSAAFVLAVDGSEPERVTAEGGRAIAVLWGTDGLWVTGRPRAGIGHDVLFKVGAEPLTGDRMVAVGGGEWAGGRPAELGPDELVFGVANQSNFHLVAANTTTGVVRDVIAGEPGMVAGFSGPCSGLVAAVLADSNSYGEIVVCDPERPDSLRRLTNHTRDALPDVDFIQPVQRQFTSADGTVVHGWLLRDPAATELGPLLLDVHGGPHLCWSGALQQANPYHQVLAADGWSVLLVDPRGSEGYGEAFYTGNLGRWGVDDADDLLGAVDTLVAEGTADPDRLVVAGYSYGGYLSMQLTTLTNRFAAAIAGGGISNLQSNNGSHDTAIEYAEAELAADFYRNPEAVAAASPIHRVAKVTTPTLLLHAEFDHRCPIGQSEEWFTALQHLGVPAVFVRYPDASHQFLVDGKPSHRLDYNQRIVDWARRWTS